MFVTAVVAVEDEVVELVELGGRECVGTAAGIWDRLRPDVDEDDDFEAGLRNSTGGSCATTS